MCSIWLYNLKEDQVIHCHGLSSGCLSGCFYRTIGCGLANTLSLFCLTCALGLLSPSVSHGSCLKDCWFTSLSPLIEHIQSCWLSEFLDATHEHRGRHEPITFSQGRLPLQPSSNIKILAHSTSLYTWIINDFYPPSELPRETGVQVRVEHTVKLDHRLRTLGLGNYSQSNAGSVFR